ncbi:MAG TPA: SpoIIE family protein phosphatase [Candidatus Polarisedimenticolia bacterium]|nr:SpoIIE family protein phosphatase [Candidatus Polarisedimenticolia bacterium]
MRTRIAAYGSLLALFCVAAYCHTRHSIDSTAELTRWRERVTAPFDRAVGTLQVGEVGPEAEAAGLKVKDRIATIAGRPYTGRAALASVLESARPGDPLVMTVERGSGAGPTEIISLTIPLAPSSTHAPGRRVWLVTLIASVAMPAFCLLLGFWVVAVRPTDPLAWLLLSLMLSFGQITTDPPYGWGGWAGVIGLSFHALCATTWPLSMMLFGLYFPERLPFDRRWPWAKWVLLVPLCGTVLVEILIVVGSSAHLRAVLPLEVWLEAWQIPVRVLGMASIGLFFMFLGIKVGLASSSDARRRLNLLSIGTSIAMAPSFLVAVLSMVRRTSFQDAAPAWLVLLALLMMFLFPLTLAYVIVVHRALDVRVVIRQGLQYAFARRGIRVLQAVIVLAILGVMSLLVRRPELRRVEAVGIVGVSLVLVVLMGRIGEWLGRWTDRRFFRDAYNAEQILSDLNEKVRTMVEVGPLVEMVAGRISESLHVPRLMILLEEAGVYLPAHAIGWQTPPPIRFAQEGGTVQRLRGAHEPVRVQLDRPASWVNRATGPDLEELESLRALGSQLLLPLSIKERLPGFVSLGPKLSEEPYSGSDLRLLSSVALQTALALENSRLASAVVAAVAQRERLVREVEIAREVQERLFPQTLPELAGLDFAGHCRPALGVGGDYYDFLSLPGGRLGVAIGDVSGKGIAAALMMASLQASLRGQTMQGEGDLARLVSNVNRLVYDASPDNRYATFFYAQYDPATRRLAYVNAGHCAPILLRPIPAGKEVIRLKAGGTVVGLFEASRYVEASVVLEPGDVIVAYTDGISEALNPAEEEWGEDNLIEAAHVCRGLAAQEMIGKLLTEADRFVSGAEQHDDMTLVVLRMT